MPNTTEHIINNLANHYRYSKKLDILKSLVGAENILRVSYVGHDYNEYSTKSRLGKIPTLPVLFGRYDTVIGVGDEYSSSTVKLGQTFEHEGNTWTCVHLRKRSGDAETFSTYSMMAVKL